MLKISLNYMLNRGINFSIASSLFWGVYWLFLSARDGKLAHIIMIIFTLLFIGIGAMLPKLPETIFIMPVSKVNMECHIKKLFVGKLVVAALLETVLMVVAVLCNIIMPAFALLLVIDTVAVSYALVLTSYYQGKNVKAQERLVTGVSMLSIAMFFTAVIGEAAANASPDGFSRNVIIILILIFFTLISWALIWYKPVTTTNRMCADLADYEKLTVTNMPLDKRAKLKEKGII